MERHVVPFDHALDKTLARLANPGLLLVGTKTTGESNVMTIGWGTVGIIWGKQVFAVLVRPSRYTYEFIEESGAFTVNVPTDEMRAWTVLCGTKSGRDIDKFGPHGMTLTACEGLPAATIDACPMVYECRVVHHNDVIPAHLAPEIEARSYRGADYHRIYYGEILAARAAEGY
jgi:flavin reductase (DIM6/NTAB) family NADH-FMN oxidoreductase RutF